MVDVATIGVEEGDAEEPPKKTEHMMEERKGCDTTNSKPPLKQ